MIVVNPIFNWSKISNLRTFSFKKHRNVNKPEIANTFCPFSVQNVLTFYGAMMTYKIPIESRSCNLYI